MASQPRYKLKLTSLKFLSLVDRPAQETAGFRLMKSAAGPGEDVEATMRIVKVGTGESPLVHGWAFTCTDESGQPYHDLQGDAVTEFIKAAEEWLASGGAVDEMHNSEQSARIAFAYPIDSDIVTALIGKEAGAATKISGLAAAVRPTPDQLVKIRSGEYNGFSIAGTGIRELVKARGKKKPKKPGATQSAPYKSVAKMAVLTSSVDGHQHSIDLDAPSSPWSGQLATSYQTEQGAEEEHCHPWVYDATTGKITIGDDSGHTHDVTDVVPPHVLAAVAAREAEEHEHQEAAPEPVSDEPSGGATVSVHVAARAPGGISTPSDPARTVKGNSQENPTMDPKFAKMLTLALLLPEPQRAHVAKLGPDDQVAFLGLDAGARDAAVKAAEAADPVVHTTKSGTAIRKSHGELALVQAKQLDAQAEQLEKQAQALAASQAAEQQATFEKRAGVELSHFAKGLGVRAAIVKALETIPDEAVRKEALEAMKGANAAMRMLSKSIGTDNGGAGPEAEDPLKAYETGLAKHAASIDPKMHPVDATAAFLATPEGKALKAAYDATRGYAKN